MFVINPDTIRSIPTTCINYIYIYITPTPTHVRGFCPFNNWYYLLTQLQIVRHSIVIVFVFPFYMGSNFQNQNNVTVYNFYRKKKLSNWIRRFCAYIWVRISIKQLRILLYYLGWAGAQVSYYFFPHQNEFQTIAKHLRMPSTNTTFSRSPRCPDKPTDSSRLYSLTHIAICRQLYTTT